MGDATGAAVAAAPKRAGALRTFPARLVREKPLGFVGGLIVLGNVVVVFTVGPGGIILQESTIGCFGFGIPPPTPSRGSMLSMEGRVYIEQAPLLELWPGLCLAIVVYGINMFGDALRDLLDPRLRGSGRFARGGSPPASLRRSSRSAVGVLEHDGSSH